jgi:polyisoprenoid-binding protein YceI
MTTNTKTIWAIDPNHSIVQFKVKHLAVSNVSGNFNVFSGNLETNNETFNDSAVHFEIDTNSVDTNNSERDGHLMSPHFFDAAKFPKITFKGTLQKAAEDFLLLGELTMLETTKTVKLSVEFTGTGTGRFGDTRAGFEINGKLNRKDYGLNFGLLTEAGSLVVGEEIKLHCDIQLIKQAATAMEAKGRGLHALIS